MKKKNILDRLRTILDKVIDLKDDIDEESYEKVTEEAQERWDNFANLVGEIQDLVYEKLDEIEGME